MEGFSQLPRRSLLFIENSRCDTTGVESTYVWEGKVETEAEFLLLIKTQQIAFSFPLISLYLAVMQLSEFTVRLMHAGTCWEGDQACAIATPLWCSRVYCYTNHRSAWHVQMQQLSTCLPCHLFAAAGTFDNHKHFVTKFAHAGGSEKYLQWLRETTTPSWPAAKEDRREVREELTRKKEMGESDKGLEEGRKLGEVGRKGK